MTAQGQDEPDSLRDQLVHALAGQYVNVIQRRPDMFVHVVGPLTATSVDELADALLPVMREAIAAELARASGHVDSIRKPQVAPGVYRLGPVRQPQGGTR